MSPRTVCKLERFKECSKALPKSRPWQEFCCDGHRTRFRYLMDKRRRRNKRNRAASNACSTHSPRVRCRRYIEVGSVRKALMVLSESRPEFFLRLGESIPGTAANREIGVPGGAGGSIVIKEAQDIERLIAAQDSV